MSLHWLFQQQGARSTDEFSVNPLAIFIGDLNSRHNGGKDSIDVATSLYNYLKGSPNFTLQHSLNESQTISETRTTLPIAQLLLNH